MPNESDRELALFPASETPETDESREETFELDEETEAAEAERAPWEESDFVPYFDPQPGDYVSDGGETFKVMAGRDLVRVCGFVPEPLGEVRIIHDLDHPSADNSHVVTLRYTMPTGEVSTVGVAIDKGKNLASAVIDGVPSGVAQLSVARRNDIAPATAAFTSPAFASRTLYGQTGWLPDGRFALPGGEDVSLERLGVSPGVALLNIPPVPDPARLKRGAEVLLRIHGAASPSVTGGILGALAAGPMFRRKDHLGARASTTLVAGPTGAGKTLLTSRLCCLVGSFWQQPGCVATWRTTLPTLEAFLCALRDQTVFIDNFRLADEGARERFRQVVISVGDGIGRGRSSYGRTGVRVVGAPAANSLVLATGEDSFADDAAVSARLLEFHAEDVDCDALLSISTDDLDCLPHVFSQFIHYLSALPPDEWARRRARMNELASSLTHQAEARTSEHLALITVALVTFCEFMIRWAPVTAKAWREIGEAFVSCAPDLAVAQALRVREERIDQLVLREIARAIRQGKVCLEPLDVSPGAPTKATVLGAYDADSIYLIPDVATRWAATEVRSAGRRAAAIGRKGLGWALQARGGDDGEIRFLWINNKRTRAWRVRRSGLGATWEGLLDDVPPSRGQSSDPSHHNGVEA